VKIVLRYWTIAVNGHRYEVGAGGEISYPVCDTVESITPVVMVNAQGRAGHAYAAKLRGSLAVGESAAIERSFKGPRYAIEAPFVATQFAKLTEGNNSSHLPPGSYTLELSFGKPRDEFTSTSTPKAIETITLVAREGC
jgi:hypothetical protein